MNAGAVAGGRAEDGGIAGDGTKDGVAILVSVAFGIRFSFR